MDIFILSFPHGLIPVIGFLLDLLSYIGIGPIVDMVLLVWSNIALIISVSGILLIVRVGNYTLDQISFVIRELGHWTCLRIFKGTGPSIFTLLFY